MRPEAKMENGDLCRRKNFFYFFIIDTREMSRESGIILKGYVNHHITVCPYATCPIKAFKKQMEQDKQSTLVDRKKFSSGDQR